MDLARSFVRTAAQVADVRMRVRASINFGGGAGGRRPIDQFGGGLQSHVEYRIICPRNRPPEMGLTRAYLFGRLERWRAALPSPAVRRAQPFLDESGYCITAVACKSTHFRPGGGVEIEPDAHLLPTNFKMAFTVRSSFLGIVRAAARQIRGKLFRWPERAMDCNVASTATLQRLCRAIRLSAVLA
jgi:hypothetical protein